MESISTPVESTPEQKYGQIHRSIENGFSSSKARLELGRVCIELKKFDEAVSLFRQLPAGQEKIHLHGLLKRAGVPLEDAPMHKTLPEHDLGRSLSEEFLDSVRFLFEDPMPLALIVATAGFPAAMGLGGLLTAVVPFIPGVVALIPVLVVLGAVAAFCARIVKEASSGLEDAPRIPRASVFMWEVAPALGRLTAVVLGAFAPAILGILFGLPLMPVLGLLLIGAAIAPIAYHNLEITLKWSSLAPRTLGRTIAATRRDYPGFCGVVAGLLTPCAALALATIGSPLYVQIALVGCFLAGPLMIAARLLGRFHQRNLRELAFLVGGEVQEMKEREGPVQGNVARFSSRPTGVSHRAVAAKAAPAGRPQVPAPVAAAKNAPPRVAADLRVPVAAPAPKPQVRKRRVASPAARPVETPAPKPQGQKRPVASPASPASGTFRTVRVHPDYQRPAVTNARPTASAARAVPAAAVPAEHPELPGLTNFPGLRVVRNDERVRAGAASFKAPVQASANRIAPASPAARRVDGKPKSR